MTTKTKLEVRRAEIRKKLADLAAAEGDVDADEIRRLTGEITDIETRLSALAVADDTDGGEGDGEGDGEGTETEPDGEAKELARLESRAQFTGYLKAVAEETQPDGAEKELLEARGMNVTGGGTQQFPLSMLAAREADIEDRVDKPTAVTVDLATRPNTWLTRLFDGQASGMFVTRRSVPPGVQALPFLSAGGTGDHAAPGVAVDAEEATISVTEQKPGRAVARYLFRLEDAARFGPILEDQLTADARRVLTDRMEYSIFNGDTPAVGLKTELTRLLDDNETDDAAQATVTTADRFLDLILKNLDGRYASMPPDVKIVGPPQLAQFLEGTKLVITAAYESELLRRRLKDLDVDMMLTGHVDVISGNQYPVYFVRRRGVSGRPAAVHSVWESGMLIRDPYTKASSGEVSVTVTALHRFDVIDTAAILARRVTLA